MQCCKDGEMRQRRWRTGGGGGGVTHIRVAVNSTDRTRIAGRRRRKASPSASPASSYLKLENGQHKISENQQQLGSFKCVGQFEMSFIS